MKGIKLFLGITFIGFSSVVFAQTNTFPTTGNVGIGTLTPSSKLTIRSGTSGVSIHPMGSPYYGMIAFNREAATGAIFDPSGQAFQINNGTNGSTDKNLHFQVYNGNGTQVTNNALVISGIDGSVGIGIAIPTEKLSVNGNIRAKEIKVETANWPDYVFEDNYKLPDLQETEVFIKTNKYLPGMPSAATVEKEGVSLGEMNRKLLEKVEELTLHLIEKEKENEQIKTVNKTQEYRISELEKQYSELKSMILKINKTAP